MNYVDMKMQAQINRIKNPSEKETEEVKNKNPNRDFVYCTFPVYEGHKLRGITEQIYMITGLGDKGAIFFITDFSLMMRKNLRDLDRGERSSPTVLDILHHRL